jgi:hypothetical protein
VISDEQVDEILSDYTSRTAQVPANDIPATPPAGRSGGMTLSDAIRMTTVQRRHTRYYDADRFMSFEVYAEICVETREEDHALAVAPPDLLKTSSGHWVEVKGADRVSREDEMLSAIELHGYLRGRLDERRERGELGPGGIALSEKILMELRALKAMQQVGNQTGFRISEEVKTIRASQLSQENLILDTVIRINDTLDQISDESATKIRKEVIEAWEQTHADREKAELLADAAALVGENAWGLADDDTRSDLKAHLILKREGKPEAAVFAALAVCIAFERELKSALRRAGTEPANNLERLLSQAYARQDDDRLLGIAEAAREHDIHRHRNDLAHPGRRDPNVLNAVEQAVLGSDAGLDGHCLLSNVIMAIRPKG